MAAPTERTTTLASLFESWHPRYRTRLLQLTFLAAAVAVLVYAESYTLGAFGEAFKNTKQGECGDVDNPIRNAVVAHLCHTPYAPKLPLLVVFAFGTWRLLRLVIEGIQRLVGGALQNKAQSDLEAELLGNLLRKDDVFFSSRSAGEISGRFSVDIVRVVDARIAASQERQAILCIVASLLYFAIHAPWGVCVAGAVSCVAGALWMARVAQPLREMDREYLASDDRVRASFEDLTRAAPEVQIGHFGAAVCDEFDVVQRDRRMAHAHYVRQKARLNFVSGFSYVAAFVALCIMPIVSREHAAHATLVAVILKALPELFVNSSALVMHRLAHRLADTSRARLLEFDAGPSESDLSRATAPESTEALSVELDSATYQYATADGAQQGGVVDVSTRFDPGRWVAIVGAAGSGKSTMMQLVLGRIKPTRGHVTLGGRDVDEMKPDERAAQLALMPQTLSVLDTTIEGNLLFGRRSSEKRLALCSADNELLEAAGVAAISRIKALGMLPTERAENAPDFGPSAQALRPSVRKSLEATGVHVDRYEDGGVDAQHWALEGLLRGRTDRQLALDILLAPAAREQLQRIARSPLGTELMARARALLLEWKTLLALPTFVQFSSLSPILLDERVWALRASLSSGPAGRDATRRLLVLTALTATRAELPRFAEIVKEHERAPAALRDLGSSLGDAFCGFDVSKINPFLTWRENLVFGAIDARNWRIGQQVEHTIIESVEAGGFASDFARLGFDFKVGRGGSKLSGGQRQLLALARTLLRRTPVVVMDEPTSALDPNSRSRIAQLLTEWKRGRIIVTVSHDPALVKDADEIRVLHDGRLVASGTFAELQASSAVFRETMNTPS